MGICRRGKTTGALMAIFSLVVVGCGTTKSISQPNDMLPKPIPVLTKSISRSNNMQPKTIPVYNVILAKSMIPGRSGQQLELIDVKGQHTSKPIIGPIGDNYTGQFQLRVVNSMGKMLFKFDLPDNKDNPLVFGGKFQFHLADYNGDGSPDFTLGQYADSNGYWYRLYTIKSSGLYQLPTAQLFVSGFTTYSPSFTLMKPNGFQIKYYDNSKAEWFRATYEWNDGKFVQSSSKAVPPYN